MRALAILATALLLATALPTTAQAAHSGPICTHEYFDYVHDPVWVVTACNQAALRWIGGIIGPLFACDQDVCGALP